jgi:hypothetical protein
VGGDPAIDIGVPAGGCAWPIGLHRVPLGDRWLYAFASLLPAARCYEQGMDCELSTVPGLRAMGARHDSVLGGAVVFAELESTHRIGSEPAVVEQLGRLLARCGAEELVDQLVGA